MSTHYRFDAWYRPSSYCERILYVGCVHEINEEITRRLQNIPLDPPDHLIFTGDVTGSTRYNNLKRHFYNLFNLSKWRLGYGADHEPSLSNAELCDRTDPHNPRTTVRELHFRLHQYMAEISNADPPVPGQFTDVVIANDVRRIAREFNYYGPWLWTQPRPVLEAAVADIRPEAEKFLALLKPTQERSIPIVIVGGNDDNVRKTYAGIIEQGIDVFDPIPLFRQHSIDFRDQISYLVTDTSIQVLVPYWELQNFTGESQNRFDKVMTVIATHRASKTVVMVVHTEPNWVIHNLTSNNPLAPPQADRKIVINQLGKLIANAHPDQIIYPHQHTPIRDSDAKIAGLNTKYVLRIVGDEVCLVENANTFGQSGQSIVTHIPKHHLAMLTVPRRKDTRPRLFDGDCNPAFVF